MAALAFDTLDASKTQRNAGVDERMVEAIVQIVQRTIEMPDISHLRAEIERVRQEMATKDDLELSREEMVTKEELRAEILSLEVRLTERLRTQGWQLFGALAELFGVIFAVMKFAPGS